MSPVQKKNALVAWLCAASLLLSTALVLPAGCGRGKSPSGVGFGPGNHPIGVLSGSCKEGESRNCSATLGEHNGVLTCYHGTQQCVGGVWSECGNGTVTNQGGTRSGGPGPSTLSLSLPAACQNNPCDPFCQNFIERPEAGLTADAGNSFIWSGGVISISRKPFSIARWSNRVTRGPIVS